MIIYQKTLEVNANFARRRILGPDGATVKVTPYDVDFDTNELVSKSVNLSNDSQLNVRKIAVHIATGEQNEIKVRDPKNSR